MIKRILLMIGLLAMMAMPSWAVVNSTISQNEYACNSSNTSWAYTFPIILTSDIQVWTIDQYGNPTQQTSNFSVNTVTQSVTYPVSGTPCATGNNLLLLRVEPFTQSVAASNQGPAPSPVVMGMSDKLTMLAQQIESQINRAVLAPIGSTSSSGYSLPSPLANAYIGWDSTGTYLVNLQTGQPITPASSPTFAGLTITGLNGIGKYVAGVLGIANADVDYSVPNGVETLTNKTYDTAGTGNVFKIGGTTYSGSAPVGSGNIVLASGIKGNSGYVASAYGSPTTNNCAKWDANGNLVDNGSTCSGGTGMVYPGSSGIAVSNTSAWQTSLTAPSGTIVGTSDSQVLTNKTIIASTDKIGGVTMDLGSDAVGDMYYGGASNVLTRVADVAVGSYWASGGVTTAPGWATLNQAAVAGLTTGSSPTFAGLTVGSISGVLKGSSGTVSAATAGTDYAAPTSGSVILSGNGSGGFSNVTIGTGLSFTGGTLSSTVTSKFVPNNIQVFTSSGTWTKPAGVSNVYVKVIGEGGTGGTSGSDANGKSGGGGAGGTGGYSEGVIAVTGNVPVTIGATSSFAGTTTIQATAGSNGSNGGNAITNGYPTGGAGGAGGVGSNGTINLTGSVGGNGAMTASAGASNGLGGTPNQSPMGSIGQGGAGGTGSSAAGSSGDAGAVIVYY